VSLSAFVKSSFLALVESGNVRYVVQPTGAPTAAVSDGAAAAWAWSAYVEIVPAGTITDPSWLCGVILHTTVIEAFNGDFAIASGAAAAEVDLAIVPYSGMIATAATDAFDPRAAIVWLPYPIKITGSPRLAVRVRKNTAASAAGASLKVILAEAVGT
jgi:hypothetical protein